MNKRNAFGSFYEETNDDAIRVLRKIIKNDNIRYFIIKTNAFEYTVTKLGDLVDFRYLIEKETGYKLIKKQLSSPNEVIDFFKNKNEAIEFIKKTESRENRRGAIVLYQRPYGIERNKYRNELLEKQPKQINIPEKDNCAICLEVLSNGQPICKPSTCEHYFHCDCISKIRPNRKGEIFCPLCREQIYRSETFQYVSNKFGNKRTKSTNFFMKTLLKDIKTLKKIKF